MKIERNICDLCSSEASENASFQIQVRDIRNGKNAGRPRAEDLIDLCNEHCRQLLLWVDSMKAAEELS